MDEIILIEKLKKDLMGKKADAIEVGEFHPPDYDFNNLKYKTCDIFTFTFADQLSGTIVECSFQDIHVQRRLAYSKVIFYLLQLQGEKKIALNINL